MFVSILTGITALCTDCLCQQFENVYDYNLYEKSKRILVQGPQRTLQQCIGILSAPQTYFRIPVSSSTAVPGHKNAGVLWTNLSCLIHKNTHRLRTTTTFSSILSILRTAALMRSCCHEYTSRDLNILKAQPCFAHSHWHKTRWTLLKGFNAVQTVEMFCKQDV